MDVGPSCPDPGQLKSSSTQGVERVRQGPVSEGTVGLPSVLDGLLAEASLTMSMIVSADAPEWGDRHEDSELDARRRNLVRHRSLGPIETADDRIELWPGAIPRRQSRCRRSEYRTEHF